MFVGIVVCAYSQHALGFKMLFLRSQFARVALFIKTKIRVSVLGLKLNGASEPT